MLIVACRLCVIDVRERFQCIGYDNTACMKYMVPMSAVPQKAVKLCNHSLTLSYPPPTTHEKKLWLLISKFI